MAAKRKTNVDLVTMAQNHGGFSVKEDSGNFGAKGTYASWEGTEDVVEGTLTSNRVRQFREGNAGALARPGAYLGGYREPEGVRQRTPQRPDDVTYLDVSRRFTGPSRVERALEFGRKQGQVSVYDTEAGLQYVHENAAVPEKDRYSYSAEMADATRAQKSGRSDELADAVIRAQSHVVGGINEARDEAMRKRAAR